MSPVAVADVRAALQSRPPTRIDEEVRSRAAVAMILHQSDAGLELLFIRRAEDARDPWSGQMAFPGGRQDPEDATLLETAVRETREEIGIDLARGAELLGSLDEVRARAQGRELSMTIVPYVFRLSSPAQTTANYEVRSVHWLRLEDLLDPGSRTTMAYPWEGATLRLPCLKLVDLTIWGLTYRMFGELADRLMPGGSWLGADGLRA